MKVHWIARRTSAHFLQACCPGRRPDTHKGDYGRLLLLCGAEGYTGAPVLAAKAALRSGAGLIYLGVPRSVYPIVAAKLDEPIVFPLPDKNGRLSEAGLPEILSRLKTMDACLLGPGLGRSMDLDYLVCNIIRSCPCPLILDADGINAVASHIDVLREAACPLILTPHEGEFSRLVSVLGEDRVSDTEKLARKIGGVILRKGNETIITDGKKTFINRTGNAGMATGGSGDVLSGILVSLIGQGNSPVDAAAASAWIHGRAGDLAAAEFGQYAMTPSDIIDKLTRLLP